VTVLVRGGADAGEAARVTTPATAGPWALEASVTTTYGARPTVGGRFVATPPRSSAVKDAAKRLRVEGDVPPRGEVAFDVPVPDPIAHFGGAFLSALAAEGVVVEGGARAAASEEDRRPGTRLAAFQSPLAPAVAVMDRRSHNFYASLLFKAAGAAREGAGSWESGERAVADVLARRGALDPGCRVVDGSGLARASRLTAGALARLLLSFDRDLLRGPVLRESLAVPGDEEGTMRKRLRDADARARVRVKTGTLEGVRALAGYVDGRDGSRGYAFAVLLNASPADGDARDLLDDVVRELLQG
jgi:D-alanyl-D-alanine carboxypeptidase/D-alanyl-D-alanine-endopeptidase (penicillin-binding protein 4)